MIRLRYSMRVGWFNIEMRKNSVHPRNPMTLRLACGAIACFVAGQEALSAGVLDSLPLEEAAYYKVNGAAKAGGRDYKNEYLKKLSPGGKAYFLACRHDYKEALWALEKVPKRNTGSYYYVKAFCLEGLGKHAEAARNYDLARSKIGASFSPGFRFYLECATAYMRNGEEKKAQENLDIAGPESEEYGKYEAYPRFVRMEIKKRKVAVVELKGRYKEAFEKYLQDFNHVSDQFHLKESLEGDTESKARARSWLSVHAPPPPGNPATQEAVYYLTAGKANMVLGNIAEAKKALEKAIHASLLQNAPVAPIRRRHEDVLMLRQIGDQAKSVLVKIYYKEQNYRKCCEYMRTLFKTEVMESIDTIYNTIAMHDVAELVTDKDVDLHDRMMMFKLDKGDLVYPPPAK